MGRRKRGRRRRRRRRRRREKREGYLSSLRSHYGASRGSVMARLVEQVSLDGKTGKTNKTYNSHHTLPIIFKKSKNNIACFKIFQFSLVFEKWGQGGRGIDFALGLDPDTIVKERLIKGGGVSHVM